MKIIFDKKLSKSIEKFAEDSVKQVTDQNFPNSRAVVRVSTEEHCLSPVVSKPVSPLGRQISTLRIIGSHASLEILKHFVCLYALHMQYINSVPSRF